MTDDDLVKRAAHLEAAAEGLSALDDLALVEEWPAAERAALSDERDAVADESDDVAVSFDGRAERRDQDAVFRQSATQQREHEPHLAGGTYDRYMANRDRDSAAADRANSARDRKRARVHRKIAADGRRRSAADRDQAALVISELSERDLELCAAREELRQAQLALDDAVVQARARAATHTDADILVATRRASENYLRLVEREFTLTRDAG